MWLLIVLLLLFASPVFAQDRPWIIGGAIAVTVEPDAAVNHRSLSGPLSGSATAVVGWGGRVITPRWRLVGELSTAREFTDDVMIVADLSRPISLHRRHRDLSLMAVAQFNAVADLWLSAAGGVINARVREEGTETIRSLDGGVSTVPVPPHTDSRWEGAFGLGAEYHLALASYIRLVPSGRLHLFNHDPAGSPPRYGLADYTLRFAIGAEFGF